MELNHEDGCRCVICSGEMTRTDPTPKEDLLMQQYGWYAHCIIGDPYVSTGVNYHTHGFERSLNHPDLQIVLPTRNRTCHGIAKAIYDQIKGGKTFRNGDETTIPHQDGSQYPVRFIEVREGDRNVLRVILPNSKGKLEPQDVAQGSEPEYALQWTV